MTPAESSIKKEDPGPRRNFLNRLWKLLGILALVELGWLFTAILRKSPKMNRQDKDAKFILAGLVEEIPPATVTAIPEGQFYLTRLQDGSFLALSKRCTHLGCTLAWDDQSTKFICPCHGSSFDISGEVLTPPANRGLDSHPIRIENGKILVNTAITEKWQSSGQNRSVKA